MNGRRRMKDENSVARRRGPEVPGYLRVPEAAARIGVAPGTIYRWIASGLIPSVRVGSRAVRLRAEVVDAQVREVPATGIVGG